MTGLPLGDLPLKDVEANVIRLAKHFLMTDGFAAPVAHIIGRNLDPDCNAVQCAYLVNLAEFMQNDERKEILSWMMPKLCKQVDACAVVMVSESWTVGEVGPEKMDEVMRWRDEHGSLEGHPRCVEMLTVHTQTRMRTTIHGYEILRDADGKITGFGEDVAKSKDFDGVEVTGRMCDWLREVPGEVN
jgi:hypothetical protein